MNGPQAPRSGPPERVPTLTEVVAPVNAAPSSVPPDDRAPGAVVSVLAAPGDAAAVEHDSAMAQRLLADMQQHIDRVLETRIAAAVEPLLEHLSARLLDEARGELASTLREAMAVALARELSRHRGEAGPR